MNPRKNTMALAARFSAASATYHQAADVQQQVAQELVRLFPDLPLPKRGEEAGPPPARVLEIGCGTGVLTALVRRRYPEIEIDAVDISARMIAQARTRLDFDRRIRWRVSDVEHLPSHARYPLIVSSSVFHWISPLEDGLTRLAGLMVGGGWLVFALMVRGTLGELLASRLRVAPHKPPVGRLPALPQVRRGLRWAGLEIVSERKEIRRTTCPSADLFLRQIHAQGLTGGTVSIARVPLNRRELRQLVDDYQAHYRAGQGVRASYHVVYFKVRKEHKE